MKYIELEREEKDVLLDFEKKAFRSAKNTKKEILKYKSYVSAMLKKGKNINIRLSEHDLLKLKAKALEEGLPYQTYLSSLVHKNLQK